MRWHEIGCVVLLLAVSLSGCLRGGDAPRPLVDEEQISDLPSPVHNATSINVTTREVRQLTSQPISDPRFAPDGDLVFLGAGDPPRIERLNRRPETVTEMARGYSPVIGAERLYWVSDTSSGPTILTKLVDGSNETSPVYEASDGCRLGHERGLDVNRPGTALAFVEDCESTPGGETSKIKLLDLMNGTTRTVSVGDHPRFESTTTILHDQRARDGDRQILRQNLTTGRQEVVVPASDPGIPSHPVPGPGGSVLHSVLHQREDALGGDVHEIRFEGSWGPGTRDSGAVLSLERFAIGVFDVDPAGNEIVLDILRQDRSSP